MILNQTGAVAVPLSPSVPIAIVPNQGVTSVNSKNGTLVVNTTALSQEIAATLAPSLLRAGGDKSQEEYDKHVAGTQAGLDRIQELQNQLSQTKKGSKERRAIQEKIDQETKIWRSHEKEISQKWPNGRPEN